MKGFVAIPKIFIDLTNAALYYNINIMKKGGALDSVSKVKKDVISGMKPVFSIKFLPAIAFVILTAYVLISVFAFPKEGYMLLGGYFNQYKSSAAYTKLEDTLELSEGTSVSSYDATNRVFVTQRLAYVSGGEDTGDGGTTLTVTYGFAWAGKEYVQPIYSKVISIDGDYAIVNRTTPPDELGETEERIGVIKFRNTASGNVQNLTSFSDLSDDTASYQMRFVSDKYGESYIAVRNELGNIDHKKTDMTFYEYKLSDHLVPVFKVKVGLDYVNMISAGGNLVVIYNSYAEFYKTKSTNENGYLVLRDRYKPFYEDTDNAFSEYTTVMVSYLGNDNFLRWGYIKDSADDSDYTEMLKIISGTLIQMETTDATTGEVTTIYMFQRSDKYNANTMRAWDTDLVSPDAVMNKYNASSSRAVASYINNTLTTGINGTMTYYPPSFPVSALAAEGMSVVYYYYFPYENAPYVPAYSFVILDKDGNMFNAKDNILFPVVLVDGKGIQTDSPYYEIPYGDIQLLGADNSQKIFKEYSVTEMYGYVNTGYHDNMLIAVRYDLRNTVTDESAALYGAYNEQGKLVTTSHRFYEMSLYFGGYSIASTYQNGQLRHWQVDKEGATKEIFGVHAIKNGVYITKNNEEMFTLKTNAGTELAKDCTYVAVYEDFLTDDGEYLMSLAYTVKDGKGYISKIK